MIPFLIGRWSLNFTLPEQKTGPVRENRKKSARLAILRTLIPLLAWMSVGAQQAVTGNGGWGGVLRNSVGIPLSGATVELIAKGHKATSVTGPNGSFSFDQLPPIRYALFVTLDGHRVASSEAIDLGSTGGAREVVVTLNDQGALSSRAAAAEPETTGGVALSSHVRQPASPEQA